MMATLRPGGYRAGRGGSVFGGEGEYGRAGFLGVAACESSEPSRRSPPVTGSMPDSRLSDWHATAPRHAGTHTFSDTGKDCKLTDFIDTANLPVSASPSVLTSVFSPCDPRGQALARPGIPRDLQPLGSSPGSSGTDPALYPAHPALSLPKPRGFYTTSPEYKKHSGSGYITDSPESRSSTASGFFTDSPESKCSPGSAFFPESGDSKTTTSSTYYRDTLPPTPGTRYYIDTPEAKPQPTSRYFAESAEISSRSTAASYPQGCVSRVPPLPNSYGCGAPSVALSDPSMEYGPAPSSYAHPLDQPSGIPPAVDQWWPPSECSNWDPPSNKYYDYAAETMGHSSFSEDERMKRRREQNKQAAQRCRHRRRIHVEQLVKELQDLECNNTAMSYQIHQLRREKSALEYALGQHQNACTKPGDDKLQNCHKET